MKMIHLICWINNLTLHADLAEVFKQIGKGARDDATINVALSPSCDGKGLPTARLAIGKYGAIIASQHTVQTDTQTQTQTSMNIKAKVYLVIPNTQKRNTVCDILFIFHKKPI